MKFAGGIHLQVNSLCCVPSPGLKAWKNNITWKYFSSYQRSSEKNLFFWCFCRFKSKYTLQSSYNSLHSRAQEVDMGHGNYGPFLLRYSHLPEDKASLGCDDLSRSKQCVWLSLIKSQALNHSSKIMPV